VDDLNGVTGCILNIVTRTDVNPIAGGGRRVPQLDEARRIFPQKRESKPSSRNYSAREAAPQRDAPIRRAGHDLAGAANSMEVQTLSKGSSPFPEGKRHPVPGCKPSVHRSFTVPSPPQTIASWRDCSTVARAAGLLAGRCVS